MTGVRHPFVHGKGCFFAFVVAICLSLTAGPAKAAFVSWTFQNTVFDDGGTVTGSFDYDATTNSWGSFNVQTTTNGVFGASYGIPVGIASATTLDFLETGADLTNNTGYSRLLLSLSSPMTDAGGTISLALAPWAIEAICSNADCTSGSAFRTVISGSITGVSAVPLPGAFPLFATGLGALGLLGWRRKRKKAAALAPA